MFWLLEHNNRAPWATLLREPVAGSLLPVGHQRTAGFNTVDIGQMVPASLLFMMMLMFIGAGQPPRGAVSRSPPLPSSCWRPGRF